MAFTPRAPRTAPASAGTLTVSYYRPPFICRHYPTRWALEETEDGWEWLPMVDRVQVADGVNGAIFQDGRLFNREDLVHGMRKKGWIVIERDGPAGEFMGEIEGPGGRLHHVYVWESYESLPGVKYDVPVVDQAQRRAFLRALVEEKVVPLPPRQLRDKEIRRLQRKIARIAGKPTSASQAHDLAEAETELEAVRATPLPGEKPKRKRKAPAKKKAPAKPAPEVADPGAVEADDG